MAKSKAKSRPVAAKAARKPIVSSKASTISKAKALMPTAPKK